MFLGALRGHEAEITPLIDATLAAAEAGGQGGAVTGAHWAAAVLRNGSGRYADALAAAEEATLDANVYVSILVIPELVEAAARMGNNDVAAAALARLADTTQAGGNDLALGSRGPWPGPAERRRGRRAPVPGGGRPDRPYPAPPGPRPGPPAVRGVARAGRSPRRRAQRAVPLPTRCLRP